LSKTGNYINLSLGGRTYDSAVNALDRSHRNTHLPPRLVLRR
jgi:hypothetical protein